MLSLFGLIQAGVLEPVIENFSTRSFVEVVIDWARQASEYLQKEEGGPLAEFLLVVLCSVIASTLAFSHKRISQSQSVDSDDCYVEFLWTEFDSVPRVGEQYGYIIHYPPSKAARGPPEFTISMHNGDIAIPFTVEHDPLNGQATVQFTPRVSGYYNFKLAIEQIPVAGSPFLKRFDPGEPTATHISVSNAQEVMVTGDQTPLQLKLRLKDRYGNETFIDEPNAKRLEKMFRLSVYRYDGKECSVKYSVWRDDVLNFATVSIQLPISGIYKLQLFYDELPIKKSQIDVVVICDSRYHTLLNFNCEDSTARLRLGESAILRNDHEEIRCSIWVQPGDSPNSSRLHFSAKDDTETSLAITNTLKVTLSDKTVLLEDELGFLNLSIASSSYLFIYASLLHLTKFTGDRGKAFEERRELLVRRVRGQNGEVSSLQRDLEGPGRLIVCRSDPVGTTMKATECFDREDWQRKFQINIKYEIAADMGGLSREWFEILCIKLFDPKEGLFFSYGGPQGLVLPNSSRPASGSVLKGLEFAGSVVAKCVYESALGNQHRLTVKANFARSFLAQMLGRPVTYRHFKTDDPELFHGKVRYVLENNVEDLQLKFTDDEYSEDGKLLQEIELVPDGASRAVTEVNKFQYLNALAEFRLARRVRKQVKSFMRGFNKVSNINLLRDFDEEELELVLCGSPSYSVEDLRKNHHALGWTDTNQHVLHWFWKIVGSFSEEELSQLVQFITGSSRLPLGGFAELEPWVHLVYVEALNTLPSAHTCFNYLCLPSYDSCERMERHLRTALQEGSQGFGFV